MKNDLSKIATINRLAIVHPEMTSVFSVDGEFFATLTRAKSHAARLAERSGNPVEVSFAEVPISWFAVRSFVKPSRPMA